MKKTVEIISYQLVIASVSPVYLLMKMLDAAERKRLNTPNVTRDVTRDVQYT